MDSTHPSGGNSTGLGVPRVETVAVGLVLRLQPRIAKAVETGQRVTFRTECPHRDEKKALCRRERLGRKIKFETFKNSKAEVTYRHSTHKKKIERRVSFSTPDQICLQLEALLRSLNQNE